MRLRSILWALALCGAGWTPGIILSQEAVKDEPLIVSQAEKSKVAKEAIPTQLPNLLPTPDFKSADKPFEAPRPGDSSKPIERPLVTPPSLEKPPSIEEIVSTPVLPPLGFTGKSSILSDIVGDNDYIPMPDRWRMGFPALDRYGLGHPLLWTIPFSLVIGGIRTTKMFSRVTIQFMVSIPFSTLQVR